MIFVLIVFTFLLNWYLKNKPNYLNRFLICETSVCIIISSLKHEFVGPDTLNYLNMLKQVQGTSFFNIFTSFWDMYFTEDYLARDPGYMMFEKLISLVTTDRILFFFVNSVLFLIPFALFNKEFLKTEKHIVFSYVFYLFFLFSNFPNHVVRQCCALSFILIGYICLKHKNDKLALILFLFSSTFHKSALIVLLMYLMYKYISPKYYLIISVVLFIIVITIPQLLFNFLGSTASVYKDYFESDKNYSVIIVYFLTVLFGMIVYKIISGKIDIEKFRLEYCGVCWVFMLSPMIYVDPSAFRIIAYFLVWYSIFLPVVIDVYMKRKLITLIIFSLFLYKSIPYNGVKWFYWQDVPRYDALSCLSDNHIKESQS